MAGYETIYNEWLNRNNLKTLWDAIVDNFIHAAPAAKGDMMYWNAASTGGQGNIPTQPSHLTIGNAGQFLGVVIDGSGRVPQWQTFSKPSLTFTEAPSPTLKISVQGIESIPQNLPWANSINGGIVTTVSQLFAGDKTFLGHIHGSKNIEADWGVAAYGIASLSHGTGGGGGGTVTGIMYDGDLYTPTSGIITLPNNPSKIAWDSSYQTLTSTQKTNLLNLYAKAPSELWTQGNELADKSFVNSSIATATATFRGTVTAANDTDAAAAAALATISTKDLNDYAFVRVADTPNVGVDKYKRYKWNGSSWEFEYTLNNSSFTAAQWAAINSGITLAHVTKLGMIESGAQVNIIETIKRNGTALTVTDKTVDISVPTALSQLTDDSTHRLVTDTQKSNWTEAYNAIPILSNSIGQVAAIACDNSENIVLIDGRVTDLESYFTGADVNNALHLEGHDASYFSSSERVTTLEGYFSNGSANTALKWITPRAIKIASSDGTGESTGVNLDGSADVKLLLPSTIKASLTGNADTATKFSSLRTIELTSHVAGSARTDGENGWSITTTISDDVIENKMIKNGTIQNAKLVNSSITLNGSAVSLGGTRTINVYNGTGDNADKIRTDNGAWMIVNYASTTGKLKNAVNINGTAFDGSQAITTALWGTARNIRITDADNSNQGTQVSVNGSTDYSLPLPTDIKVGTLLATELVRSSKNIEAGWGVSAMGIADLTMSAGGGGGTVTGIKYNSSSTIYTPTGGIITLPDSVSGITWDAATRKIKVGVNGGTQTPLVQFGTAALHAHGDYATAVTISGTNLSVTNGDGTAVTTAINAATLQGHAADYFALASYFTNGVANNAARLSNTDKIGDTNKPVYFTANGVPAAISYTIGRNVAAGEDVTPYTQGDSINITNHVVKVSMTASDSPSASGNSISFIDTISQNTAGKISATKKTIYTASSTQLGLVKVGTSLTISDGVLNVGTGGVTNAMLAGSIANDKLAHSSITIGSNTIQLGGEVTAQQIATDLALGTAATHAHGDYVTAIGTSGKTLTWAKGGTAQTAITVPYAKEATTLETEPLTNQEFIFRNSPKTIGADSLKLDRILGRTAVWNQLCSGWNNAVGFTINGLTATFIEGKTGDTFLFFSATLLASHKYYVSFVARGMSNLQNNTWYVYNNQHMLSTSVSDGLNSILYTPTSDATNLLLNNSYRGNTYSSSMSFSDPTIIDLTLLYGTEIDGMTDAQILAKFESEYPGYHSYNPGQLINNSAEGLETVGFNLWDEEWEVGGIYASALNSINYIPVIPSETYYFQSPFNGVIFCYDKNKQSLGSFGQAANSFTTPANCSYIRFRLSTDYGTTYNNDICINLSDPNRNGQYEPYKRNVLDLHLDNIQVKSPNIWDEEWEVGALNTSNGATINSPEQIRSKNYIPILPNQTYFVKGTTFTGAWVALYDSNKTIIPLSGWSGGSSTSGNMRYCFNATFFSAPNAAYAKFYLITSYGATYNNDICINKSDLAFNGKYFPHGVLTFNGLKQAGDVRDETVGGKYIMRCGSYTFTGNEGWVKNGSAPQYTSNAGLLTGRKLSATYWGTVGNLIHPKLVSASQSAIYSGSVTNAIGFGDSTSVANVVIDEVAYTSRATLLTGTTVYYELATPETYELVSPIPTAMPAGTTERRLPDDTSDSVLAPFACDMTYGTNPGDIARDLNNMWHIQGDMQTRLDGISISHYKTTPSLALEDNHVVQEGNNKLYIKFHATEGDVTTQTLPGFELAVGTDNDGEHEETFSFGTVTEADILAICHL